MLALVPASVSAAPSYYGTSGLILLPDQRTTGKYSVGTTAHFMDLTNSLGASGLAGGTQVYGVNFGLADNWEIGLSQFMDGDSHDTTLNTKLRLLERGEGIPFDFTVGALDVLGTREFSGYAMGSLRLDLVNKPGRAPVNLNLHAGYGTGMFGEGPLAGAELSLTPRFSVMVEGSPGTVNTGVRVSSQNLILDLGLIDMEHPSVGIGYGMSLPAMGMGN